MQVTAGRLRRSLPDLGLAAGGLAGLAAAGAVLGLPLTLYGALAIVTLGLTWLARRLLSPTSRSTAETIATGVLVYASGWGPALGLAFVLPLVAAVSRSGSAGVARATGVALGTITLGQVLVAAGVAPIFFDVVPGHGLALAGALALVAVARDVHRSTRDQEEAERTVAAAGDRYRALVQNASDVVLVLDEQGRIVEPGPAVEAVLGHDPAALLGAHVAVLAHPEDAPAITEAVFALASGTHPRLTEARLRRTDETDLQVEIAWSDLRDHPAVGALVAHARDVSDRHALERALEHRAYHDALTGLPNRSKFTDRVEHVVARSGRRPQRFAVLFIDLDGFKAVNDELGHEAGDALLTEVAARLRSAVRDVDTPARLGGDEFAVLLEDLRDDADAVRVAERILQAVRQPIDLNGQPAHVDSSIGIAVSTGTETAGQLLRHADIAMYSAKNAGKGRYEVFEPALHLAAVERLDAERELAAAIGDDQLRLHYQPIVSLENEEIVGVEALVRWQHPERGLLSPAEFVGLAEESGLIVALGRWVLTRACQQVAAWQGRFATDSTPLRLSVNVSPRQLVSGDLVADVARALAASGLDPTCLTLEITETAVLQDTDATLHTLRELKYLGVELAIDDFGTGYSALSYLQRFPFDELKIDRSFVAGLADGTQDPTVVRAIVDICRSLQLRTVAEGIEHAEQASRTRALRCELGQGWLFARPADAAATERLLAERALARGFERVQLPASPTHERTATAAPDTRATAT